MILAPGVIILPTLSIKSLYTLALAEGEGVGTAYEYYARRLVLSPWLKHVRPGHFLIAGLPEKYGSSLDFLQIAAELDTAVTIIDERPQALEKLQTALATAQAQGWLTTVKPRYLLVGDLTALAEVEKMFDLCLSSEVLQRLTAESRPTYYRRLQQLAPAIALFAPNAGNPAHTNRSGLSGLSLSEMESLIMSRGAGEQGSHPVTPSPPHLVTSPPQLGYMDMPPFPPGIIRSEEQRAQATSGRLEAVAMWGLNYYARLEKFLPAGWRRRQSHIVYALEG